MNKLWKTGLPVVVAALMLAGVGCSSTIDAESVRKDLTPEMYSLGSTYEEHLNKYARVENTNLRQIPSDKDAIWLMERPVWLSVYPVP